MQTTQVIRRFEEKLKLPEGKIKIHPNFDDYIDKEVYYLANLQNTPSPFVNSILNKNRI